MSSDSGGGLTLTELGSHPEVQKTFGGAGATVQVLENLTDAGNARRFAAQWRTEARHCHELGKWFLWNGCLWSMDISGRIVQCAKTTASRIYAEAGETQEDYVRRLIGKHALATESEGRLQAMISLGRDEPGVAARLDEFDQDSRLLNAANGIIDLQAGSLGPHDPLKLCSKLAPVTFDPLAKCPLFDQFLGRVLPDPLVRAFLQRAVGYCLTASTIEQVLFFLYGPGANGKSVFLELLSRALGDYAARADSSSLMMRRNEGPRNDLAMLVGSRVVIASEANEGAKMDESIVKLLTGGDRITARKLYADYFTFRPTFKIILAANAKPTISSRGHAIWRRLRLIPFTVTIPESERDPHLLERLTTELPGILTWAVDGAVKWHLYGLGDAPAVAAATNAYRQEMDVLAPFLEDRCELSVEHQVAAGALFDAYVEWAGRNQERPMSKRTFGVRLSEHDIGERKGTGGVRLRTGIRLLEAGEVAQVAERDAPSVTLPHEEEVEKVAENGSPMRHLRHQERKSA